MCLSFFSDEYEIINVDILDCDEQWVDPHYPLGGSSRMLHFCINSLIIQETNLIPYQVTNSDVIKKGVNKFGDGKKQSLNIPPPSIFKKILVALKSFIHPIKRCLLDGGYPLWLVKFTRTQIVALGQQYLTKTDFSLLFSKVDSSPIYFYDKKLPVKNFKPYDKSLREKIFQMNSSEEPLDNIIQKCIKKLLPTIYLENYNLVSQRVNRILPNRKLIILNSQHSNGAAMLDFFIAMSVERHSSHHLMICHGGCYGVMDISVQEKVWARVSDSYAMWSNEKTYGEHCVSRKLPSLRLNKWHNNKALSKGNDILVFITGRYPNRYAYNSIFPYTIDDSYDDWQLRFLSSLDDTILNTIVIRDFHRSDRLKSGNLVLNGEQYHLKTSPKKIAFADAISNAKISIQTVPQTTYLETIVMDHPTICYWNPEANIIREDLVPFYDDLVRVGVLHYSPESAAKQLTNIADDPLKWWNSNPVRNALKKFRKNVCFTSDDVLDVWASYIKEKA